MSEQTEKIVDEISDARWRKSQRTNKAVTFAQIARDATMHLARAESRDTVSTDYVKKVLDGAIGTPGAKKLAAMCKAVGLRSNLT